MGEPTKRPDGEAQAGPLTDGLLVKLEGLARLYGTACHRHGEGAGPSAHVDQAWANFKAALASAAPQQAEAPDRDGARYRWLVSNSFDRQGFTQFHVWQHTWEPHSQTGEPTEWKCRVRGPALDAAIDAAMSATPAPKALDGSHEIS